MNLWKLLITVTLSVNTVIHAAENGDVLATYESPSGRKVEKIYWQDTVDDYVLISYPKDFDINTSYHINFWFPGTNGKPSAGIEDPHDAYLGFGMSYLDNDRIPSVDGGYATGHWELCQQVEKAFRNRTNVRINRRVLSGVSKGGWLAYFMTLITPKDLHGVAIIAAGQHRGSTPPIESGGEHLAILVATGETDSNYPHAQMAIPYYKQSRIHSLCYEEWLEKGHVSIISPKVIDWLDVQAKRGESKESLIQFCEQRVSDKLTRIQSIETPREQYIALRHLIRAPATHYVSKERKRSLRELGKQLTHNVTLSKWLADLKKLQTIVTKETEYYSNGRKDLTTISRFVTAYQQLALNSKHPDIARRAAFGYLRTFKNFSIDELRRKHLETTEYHGLKEQLNELRKKTFAKTTPTQAEIDQVTALSRRISKMANDAGMQAFFQVEWHRNLKIEPEISKIIKADKQTPTTWEVYSGIGY